MAKWLKPFLFGIWGLLLIPLIMPILEKWLEENIFSDPSGVAATVFRNTVATPIFESILALSKQRWLNFALVFWTGMVSPFMVCRRKPSKFKKTANAKTSACSSDKIVPRQSGLFWIPAPA